MEKQLDLLKLESYLPTIIPAMAGMSNTNDEQMGSTPFGDTGKATSLRPVTPRDIEMDRRGVDGGVRVSDRA